MPRIFITLQGQHIIVSYLFFCLTTERFDKMFSNCNSELISNFETLNSRLSSEERMKIISQHHVVYESGLENLSDTMSDG